MASGSRPFGVLGGLVFVGQQLRLDRQVALTEGISQAQDVRINWVELINDNAEVWVKGLAGEPLNAVETARFNSLARAWELTYHRAWNTSIQLDQLHPDQFARSAALDFHRHPGLMAYWRRHLEDQRLIDPNASSDPWPISVNAEIDRFESGRECQLNQQVILFLASPFLV